MSTVLQREATISSDGTIEIAVPELQPGQRVSITIEPETASETPKRHAADILAEMPGHRLFKTAEEVDVYSNEKRDSWDH